MKLIKQYTAALAALGLTVVAPVTSHAAFSSQQVVTNTAQAVVSGGSAAMSVSIRDVGTNASNTQINWTVNAGSGWTQASQYIQIASTLTLTGAGIQTYTDNTGNSANPKYTGVISSVTQSPAGLVNVTNTAALTVPTAWQIRAVGNTPEAADDPNCNGAVTQPAFCTAGGRTATGWAWFYHADKAQVANNQGATPFVNAAPYNEMETAGNPPVIQFAQGSFGNSASNTNNVFLEGNFQNTLGGTSYKTNTLTVELFTQ